MIIGSRDDHADRCSTGAEKALGAAKGDHVKWHANRERFGKRLEQAGALLPGRCWPPGQFPRRERSVVQWRSQGQMPKTLTRRGAPTREKWRRRAKVIMGAEDDHLMACT